MLKKPAPFLFFFTRFSSAAQCSRAERQAARARYFVCFRCAFAQNVDLILSSLGNVDHLSFRFQEK